jgi:hypothetical protein
MTRLVDEVHRALRQRGLLEATQHGSCEQRGLRGGLDDRGATCGERRRERSHEQHPRHEDRGDARGFAQLRRDGAGFRLQHMAGDVPRESDVIAHFRNRARYLAARLRDRLAVLARSRFASGSRCVSSAAAHASNTSWRRLASCAQVVRSNTCRAAAMAASASAVPPPANWPMGSPVAGSMLSTEGMPTHAPAIQCGAFMLMFPCEEEGCSCPMRSKPDAVRPR